ncbi:MAG: hypothetical protein ACO20H_00335 [Bacteriovoracaceae bacterium]
MENTHNTSEEYINTAWIEKLALEELNMEESGVISLNEHLDPRLFLEESSINFMNNLRDRFEVYVTRFNQYRTSAKGLGQIKIFKIANTVNDFMLFRNSLRLVFSRKSTDLISISFLSNGKEIFSPRLRNEDSIQNQSHEIKAHIGPFNDISWKFRGEEFEVDALVRHYLSEFIRLSSR